MEILYPRCAGLDIGTDEVVACVRVTDGARPETQTRTFRTYTASLATLAEWLTVERVTHVVMEATGSYWKPVWYALEHRGFELLLVNARHVKILPGRKTDVGDAAWLAELLSHGLLRGSFVPPETIRILRDLTRYRKKTIQVRASEIQRIEKTCTEAGIRLDSVASDPLGVSGRAPRAGCGPRSPSSSWPLPAASPPTMRCSSGSASTTSSSSTPRSPLSSMPVTCSTPSRASTGAEQR